MSEQELATIGLVLGFFVIFGLPIIYLVRHKAKIKRVWKEFAETNNLNLLEGRYPGVSGSKEGRYMEIGSGVGRKPISGRADSRQVVEFYAWAALNGDVPMGFIAGKRGALQGKGPIQTDSEQFNKKVWADSTDQAAGKAYLTPERQEMLLELIKYNGIVYGQHGDVPAHVMMDRAGYKVKLEWLEERKEVLLRAADKFDT